MKISSNVIDGVLHEHWKIGARQYVIRAEMNPPNQWARLETEAAVMSWRLAQQIRTRRHKERAMERLLEDVMKEEG